MWLLICRCRRYAANNLACKWLLQEHNRPSWDLMHIIIYQIKNAWRETLLENTGVRRNVSPLVICECTQSVRCEGHGKMLQLFPTLPPSQLATTIFALS